MSNTTRLVFAAALALGVLAVATSTASSAEIDVEPAGDVGALSLGRVTFTAEPASIECNVALSLDLTGNITKSEGEPVGSVDNVAINECAGGSVSATLGLPWEILYLSIDGVLPDGVRSVRLLLASAQFRFGIFFELVYCLYAGNIGNALEVAIDPDTWNVYTTGSLEPNEEQLIRYVSGPGACPSEGFMDGTFILESVQTLTRG